MTDKEIKWLNPLSEQFLREGYIRDNESVAERIEVIAETAFGEKGRMPNEEYRKLFLLYMKEGFISLSSPVWSNFGRKGGLSISCFNSVTSDSVQGLLSTASEVGTMTVYGGGTSVYLGNLRASGTEISKGGFADGPVHYSKLFDTVVDTLKQSQVRRGAAAVYLDIEHDDIMKFLEIKHNGHFIQNLFSAVCVGDKWMEEMEAGDVSKRKIWAKVLQSRQRRGIPYVLFKDNANNAKPEIYKATNSTIVSSNLCNEIMLPSSLDESFVCCLSSINFELFDEWENTKVVEVTTAFLDCVISQFISEAKGVKDLERAVKFAERHRAIGIGVIGYHSYLQRKNVAFESFEALMINSKVFKLMHERSYAESERLAIELGPAPIFNEVAVKSKKRRNTTTMAVAPTTSSSFIMGQNSQGIEPIRANHYLKDTAKVKQLYKNPYLKELLKELGKDNAQVWDNIGKNFGSVQHLDFLTTHQKDVFKTFSEISQMQILVQAAQRQQFIDQGQSLNLMIHPETPTKDVNALMLFAHKNGIKGLYYQHSINNAQEFKNQITCTSCEG